VNVLIHISWPVKAWSIPDAKVAELRARFPAVSFTNTREFSEVPGLIGPAVAAFTPHMTPEIVGAAAHLRWVHSPAAAVEGLLPLTALAERGVTITNSRGVQAVPMAEHVMGGLLVLARAFDRTLAAQRERQWIQNELPEQWPWILSGRRMTVVGLGATGTEVARRAHAFGMHVSGVRRRAEAPVPPFVERVVGADQLDQALDGSDVLVVTAPGVRATQGMIGAREIARLNRGAVLVNVARAQIVNDHAMRAALASGQLGGAVLDVFEREPLETSNALWSLPNVVLTPHSAGFRASHWDDVIAGFVDNLRRFQAGEPLVNVVDPAAGY
jgi:D-2-hydroxyacid dehydrogenase (NADP+)